MRYALQCHPSTPCRALRTVEADIVAQQAGLLAVHYRLLGDVDSLQLPAPNDAVRTDELWQHTCCELFVGFTQSGGYYEWNFSPSTAWAAYVFTGYRQDMRLAAVAAPRIRLKREREELWLDAALSVADMDIENMQFAVSVVVEELDGSKSYWALNHPAERPDFHHRAGFVAKL